MGILGGRQIDVYGATGRERHHQAGIGRRVGTKTPLRSSIRAKLHTAEERAIYAWRKAITEPVHGLIKQSRGLRQFPLRGSREVSGEFTLVALYHNLLKLWRASLAATG